MGDKILVTGGAGYIGSVLVRRLLRDGAKVRVLDNLTFGGEPLVDLLDDSNFEFQKGDILSERDLEQALVGVQAVVHLAAIVGDPACAQQPELAKRVNLEGTRGLYLRADSVGVERFVFASTCSNYGKMAGSTEYVQEDSPLAPVSIYAETKIAAEEFLLKQDRRRTCQPTCLRFSTVYGLSPRVRFDLTVNEFTKELALGRALKIYGEQFWRPYCHVVDLARSVECVLKAKAETVGFDVFNVGDTKENYTKAMLVSELKKWAKDAEIDFVSKDDDPRDYRVNCDKIHLALDFEVTRTVADGIAEIYRTVSQGFFVNPDDPKYRNV